MFNLEARIPAKPSALKSLSHTELVVHICTLLTFPETFLYFTSTYLVSKSKFRYLIRFTLCLTYINSGFLKMGDIAKLRAILEGQVTITSNN